MMILSLTRALSILLSYITFVNCVKVTQHPSETLGQYYIINDLHGFHHLPDYQIGYIKVAIKTCDFEEKVDYLYERRLEEEDDEYEESLTSSVRGSIMAEIDDQYYKEKMVYDSLGAHRWLPRVYDYLENEKGIWFFLEYKRSESFNKIISSHIRATKPFEVPQLMNIMIQILYILETLLMYNWIPMDVSPNNFLIEDSIVNIIDFGMTEEYIEDGVEIDEGEECMSGGTLPYIAEINLNTSNVGPNGPPESLIYILFEALHLARIEKLDLVDYKQKKIHCRTSVGQRIPQMIPIIEKIMKSDFQKAPNFLELRSMYRSIFNS